MILHTASETINFAGQLEEASAGFYERLSSDYPEHRSAFMSFVAENKRNVQDVKRAYYEVITDALEGGFAFDIRTEDFSLTTAAAGGGLFSEVVQQAADMEETIARFYAEAARQSRALMADVPRLLARIASRRAARVAKLKALVGQA